MRIHEWKLSVRQCIRNNNNPKTLCGAAQRSYYLHDACIEREIMVIYDDRIMMLVGMLCCAVRRVYDDDDDDVE